MPFCVADVYFIEMVICIDFIGKNSVIVKQSANSAHSAPEFNNLAIIARLLYGMARVPLHVA